MNVLVDTSVWVHHFRHGEPALVDLLQADRVLVHPMVLGEIACGTPPVRERTLQWLAQQQSPLQAGLQDVLAFIERERLYGLGCGLVDMTLLASTLMTPGAALWTRDGRLLKLAERFGVGYQAAAH
ncbi:type II toxin-antitoxin system VapC family toxin [Azohydromonas lata]|uniref:Type II toxin-antitoxin system VapC family toxin n=1 Tax=Azohydromonas lata TaxID=45677 RepID=A0ABU5ICM1_9BURK|nr:type II toxin-antitoxin system VapC family toxin [Azohydromonas lata]MDZ5456857.1 type II toxin-antitoxin system VapC family toxin [Azohydromonas lata]